METTDSQKCHDVGKRLLRKKHQKCYKCIKVTKTASFPQVSSNMEIFGKYSAL